MCRQFDSGQGLHYPVNNGKAWKGKRMVCSRCGSELVPGSLICGSCGAVVNSPQGPGPGARRRRQEATRPIPDPKLYREAPPGGTNSEG